PPGILPFERVCRRVIGRAARIRHYDDVARRIAARRDGVVNVPGILEIGVGGHRDDELGVEPRYAHGQHQRIVHHPLARIAELDDAGERGTPGREAYVLDVHADLTEAIVEHRLVTEPGQRVMVGVGAGLVVAIDRAVAAHRDRADLDLG